MTDIQAGRELDERVALEVMGWTRGVRKQGGYINRVDVPIWKDGKRIPWDVEQWAPSEYIEQAWLVVEKMLTLPSTSGGPWMLHELRSCAGHWSVRFCGDFGYSDPATADTAPLAICRAALKAVGQP